MKRIRVARSFIGRLSWGGGLESETADKSYQVILAARVSKAVTGAKSELVFTPYQAGSKKSAMSRLKISGK